MRRGQDNTEDRLPATVSGSFRETLDRAALGDPPKSPARATVKSRKASVPARLALSSNSFWRRRIRIDQPWLWDLLEEPARFFKGTPDWRRVYEDLEDASYYRKEETIRDLRIGGRFVDSWHLSISSG
jgi:hypothetical protein